jgi:hypothetical protein
MGSLFRRFLALYHIYIMDDNISSHRESTDSSNTQESRYKGRFREHMSEAYTAYPTDWPFPISESTSHKHNHSVESIASTSSASSTSSFDSFRRLAHKIKSAVPNRSRFSSIPKNEYMIKGSKKSFQKEDIKFGGLVESSNLMHYI